MNIKKQKTKHVKTKKKLNELVVICVNSSFNNTIITACEETGNVCAWASGGSAGFKNTKEATPFAAQTAAEILVNKLKEMAVKGVKSIKFKGIASGRESVLKTIANAFKIEQLEERTSIAFNGVRPPKRRRS